MTQVDFWKFLEPGASSSIGQILKNALRLLWHKLGSAILQMSKETNKLQQLRLCRSDVDVVAAATSFGSASAAKRNRFFSGENPRV